MIRNRTLTAIAATLAVFSAGQVLAQDSQNYGTVPGGYQDRRAEQRPGGFGPGGFQGRPDPRYSGHPDRAFNGGYANQDLRDGRHFDRAGFPRPHDEWRRGGRVPPEYRGRNYVVNDWNRYRLQAPPRGYQWVGVGGDFVLAAVATGLIAQIISGQ